MTTPKSPVMLPDPAIYFPVMEDRYSTRAGLTRFGHDFGNGPQDRQLFQFDKNFSWYRDNKLAVRQQAITDYVCTDTADVALLKEAAQFILQHLCREHPDFFSLQTSTQGLMLDCQLTGEQLLIKDDYSLSPQNESTYQDLFDALALQVQEDICLMQVGDSATKLVAAHLCAANHWSARDKLQMDMHALHQHVPGFADENREPDRLLAGILNKKHPYVRFAWGLSEHPILNQHPLHTITTGNHDCDKLHMRIERQVLWPIPDSEIVLFTIRTYFRDCAELQPQQLSCLHNAVSNMSKETLDYKNINRIDFLKKLKIIRQDLQD